MKDFEEFRLEEFNNILPLVKAVVDVAKERRIPIRVGVNSGSLEKGLVEKYHGVTAEGIVESAMDKVKLIEDMGYDNLVISINPRMS